MTLSTWQALGLAQLLILLLVAVAVLAWMLWRRPRTAVATQQETPQEETPATDQPDILREIHRFIEGEVARTRAQMEDNDRNLPEHVLATRVRYLQAELDALAYTETPDPFWAHLCECIDGWTTPQAGEDDSDNESLAATHSRLQRLLKEMEQEPPSQVVIRQLAVIERRLAAIQRQAEDDESDPADVADGDAGESVDSEQFR